MQGHNTCSTTWHGVSLSQVCSQQPVAPASRSGATQQLPDSMALGIEIECKIIEQKKLMASLHVITAAVGNPNCPAVQMIVKGCEVPTWR